MEILHGFEVLEESCWKTYLKIDIRLYLLIFLKSRGNIKLVPPKGIVAARYNHN